MALTSAISFLSKITCRLQATPRCNPIAITKKMSIIAIVGFEIPLKKRGADMRVKNQEISDAILKFVNKYFHENRKAPTISEIADGVGVARSTTHRYMQDLSDNGLLDYSRGIL